MTLARARQFTGLAILTGTGYLLSLGRDMVLAGMYGGTPALDIFYLALAPIQYWAAEIAGFFYLTTLPAFRSDTATDRLSRPLYRAGMVGAAAAMALVTAVALVPGLILPSHTGASGAAHFWAFVGLSTILPMLAMGGIVRAALEAHERFAPWGALPGIRSVALVAVAWTGRTIGGPALAWLSAGAVLGVAAAVTLLAACWTLLAREPLERGPTVGSEPQAASKAVLASLILGQAAVLVDNYVLARTGVGGPQVAVLGTNLLIVAQTVIGGTAASVYYPIFVRLWAAGDADAARRSLGQAARLAVYGLLPIVAILCGPWGVDVVGFVYHRGGVTQPMVEAIAAATAATALGQPLFAAAMLLRQFALGAGRPQFAAESAAVFLIGKIIGNTVLAPRYGVPGVCLASSLASAAMCAWLVFRVRAMLAGRVRTGSL